jgi:hypothetical protein
MIKLKFTLIILMFSNIIISQNFKTNNIVVDFETLKPISNVNIYNDYDNTISNENGLFVFNSNLNSVIIYHLGYDKLITDFNTLNKNDTIYLKPIIYEIEEVVISDKRQLINKVYENIFTNYPFFSFSEENFIRCILRKNGKIIKFQDIVVNIKRNSLFTNKNIKELDYDFQISNLRKAGIIPKLKSEEDFKFLSVEELYNWFSAIFTTTNYYSYTENSMVEDKKIKINFAKNDKLNQNKSLEGYYIVNLEDFSLSEVFYNTVFDNQTLIPFNQEKNVKWRTIGNEIFINYKKNIKNNKYYINNGTLKNIVEVINEDEKSIYEATYQIVNTKNIENKKVRSNFSSTKDLFKANVSFNKLFWEEQNQLLLDNELTNFLKNLKNYKSDYEIYSNFN